MVRQATGSMNQQQRQGVPTRTSGEVCASRRVVALTCSNTAGYKRADAPAPDAAGPPAPAAQNPSRTTEEARRRRHRAHKGRAARGSETHARVHALTRHGSRTSDGSSGRPTNEDEGVASTRASRHLRIEGYLAFGIGWRAVTVQDVYAPLIQWSCANALAEPVVFSKCTNEHRGESIQRALERGRFRPAHLDPHDARGHLSGRAAALLA